MDHAFAASDSRFAQSKGAAVQCVALRTGSGR